MLPKVCLTGDRASLPKTQFKRSQGCVVQGTRPPTAHNLRPSVMLWLLEATER